MQQMAPAIKPHRVDVEPRVDAIFPPNNDSGRHRPAIFPLCNEDESADDDNSTNDSPLNEEEGFCTYLSKANYKNKKKKEGNR